EVVVGAEREPHDTDGARLIDHLAQLLRLECIVAGPDQRGHAAIERDTYVADRACDLFGAFRDLPALRTVLATEDVPAAERLESDEVLALGREIHRAAQVTQHLSSGRTRRAVRGCDVRAECLVTRAGGVEVIRELLSHVRRRLHLEGARDLQMPRTPFRLEE